MNKLRGTRTYLCGAMGLADDNGVVWRQNVGSVLKNMGVTVLDPCDKPINIGLEDIESQERRKILKKNGEFDQLAKEMKIIRCVDLRMVDISDFIVVNVDINTYTVGTWEEVTTGNRQKKPIIVHIEQSKYNTPDWLLGMIPHQMIFSSWTFLVDYLKNVDQGIDTESYKRWWFFDLNNESHKELKIPRIPELSFSAILKEMERRSKGHREIALDLTDRELLEELKVRMPR